MEKKTCGCLAGGLTKAFALWTCPGCGHLQRAPRSAKAVCAAEGCSRVKGANPKGFGCCGQDWAEGTDSCGECGGAFDPVMDLGRLPHPDVDYLTETTARGEFRARDSFLRCVGCLALAE
jgi:hypothetical protein